MRSKEKDIPKSMIIKNPTLSFYFGIAGGARCYPHLFVFRSTATLYDDLEKLVRFYVFDAFQNIKDGRLTLPAIVSFYKKRFGKKDFDIVDTLVQVLSTISRKCPLLFENNRSHCRWLAIWKSQLFHQSYTNVFFLLSLWGLTKCIKQQ